MRFLRYIFCALLFVTTSVAETININWINDGETYAQTTCEIGGDLILPSPPTKRGYTFKGWISYTRSEYIESTGTQWINTRMNPTINTGFDIKFIQNNTAIDECPIGSRVAANSNQYLFFLGGNKTAYANVGTSATSLPSIRFDFSTLKRGVMQNKTFTLIEMETGQILMNFNYNNVKYSELSNSLPIWLFSANQNGGQNRPFEGKIYYCKLYEGSILIHDFIPVRRNIDNVIGMFDTVTQTFFENAGTGEFIAGPVAENQNFYE
ncbi:MAG: InlB B-repeat-containing protein [Proteobacteria bacterium]|nr:InlB B-repeat-containing protein [Candidatus Enterousia scatequi]